MNINARSIVNKVIALEHLLLTYCPHILILTETWLNDEIHDSESVPPGYNIIRKDRGSRGGGVAIILKSGIPYRQLHFDNTNESVWCSVEFENSSYVVASVYRPPNSPVLVLEELKMCLGKILTEKKKLIIGGDFNLPDIN